jgi:hypothetical protein
VSACRHDHNACEIRLFGRCLTCESHQKNGCPTAILKTDRVLEAAREEEGVGFCLACAHEQEGTEPDARAYTCDDCGAKAVYGAEELVLMGYRLLTAFALFLLALVISAALSIED